MGPRLMWNEYKCMPKWFSYLEGMNKGQIMKHIRMKRKLGLRGTQKKKY